MKNPNEKPFEVFYSDWDTDYFGIDSAVVVLKGSISEKDQEEIKSSLDKYEFVSIKNLNNNYVNNLWLGKETRAFLTDLNVQFTKELRMIDSLTTEPKQLFEVFEAYSYEERIIEIVKSAFTYSRFFNDPYLNKEKAQKIYVQWIKSAFNTAGKYFAISKDNGIVTGFLLFSINSLNSTSTIELIAVDSFYRGSQIGKGLIDTVINFSRDNGMIKINVGTQIDNIVALRFYTTNGFQHTISNTVYHYWPKK